MTISRTKTVARGARKTDSDSGPPAAHPADPDRDCPLCPRLVDFRNTQRAREPAWFNAPVPSFGDASARLLIVGLAPGLQGANRTGRPFTGDYAGELLYGTLLQFGFAKGKFEARPDDGLTLVDCRISNAVRCVPPQNKPLPAEINQCRSFLGASIAAMPRLRSIVALGRISHDTMLKLLGLRAVAAPFGHGAVHQAGGIRLYDSYHCSRYNTNTGVLTTEMFHAVFARVKADLD
ncbi:uracil-DNA glycosylase [Bradyrhizobium sp. SSBR45G]|uniref:uracil-DNA glycosylase n=1 Tax=unclassified Bradyrhizobium TaxID=2631580 RepID=UPI002342B95F|nr:MULTISPECIES: uracil-DNA glycosylase [unclassified Bradyrhizobium]GLH75710.1 uracil-DNA glycosylase [Bradyrhizobium sp. SSBR45G]GLH85724.1 uracil-DNA glycosylase [Bradyrhizobium sp. SSBR45R]